MVNIEQEIKKGGEIRPDKRKHNKKLKKRREKKTVAIMCLRIQRMGVPVGMRKKKSSQGEKSMTGGGKNGTGLNSKQYV